MYIRVQDSSTSTPFHTFWRKVRKLILYRMTTQMSTLYKVVQYTTGMDLYQKEGARQWIFKPVYWRERERDQGFGGIKPSSQINLLPRRPIRVGWPVLTCPANPMCDVAMQLPTSWADIPQGVWICLNGPREVRTEQRHKLLQICILFAQMDNKDLDMWTEPRMGLMNIRRVVNNADKRQNIAQTQL